MPQISQNIYFTIEIDITDLFFSNKTKYIILYVAWLSSDKWRVE